MIDRQVEPPPRIIYFDVGGLHDFCLTLINGWGFLCTFIDKRQNVRRTPPKTYIFLKLLPAYLDGLAEEPKRCHIIPQISTYNIHHSKKKKQQQKKRLFIDLWIMLDVSLFYASSILSSSVTTLSKLANSSGLFLGAQKKPGNLEETHKDGWHQIT